MSQMCTCKRAEYAKNLYSFNSRLSNGVLDLAANDITEILVDPGDVLSYVDDVRKASDSNKKSLGFLPASLFASHAHRGRLYIAIGKRKREYRGHLLFDLSYPHATVLQMYASPTSRRNGTASKLLEMLKGFLNAHEYLSIRARVAEDLAEANAFWQRQGFVVSRRTAGGETTGRTILSRVFELESPQLFPRSGLSGSSSHLGLPKPSLPSKPLYLVDLNVLFDIAHQRPNHEDAVALLRLAHLGEIQCAISDEAGRELSRTRESARPDPMSGIIESLPQVPLLDNNGSSSIIEQVANLIFPEKKYPDGLKRNDLSDSRHIATAILHQAAGFITRDARILAVAEALNRRFGINVLSARDFTRPIWTESPVLQLDICGADDFDVRAYDASHFEGASILLVAAGVLRSELLGGWLPLGDGQKLVKRAVAISDGRVVGIIACTVLARDAAEFVVKLVCDNELSFAPLIAESLLAVILNDGLDGDLRLVHLEAPLGQVAAREAAFGYGFRGSDGRLSKLSLSAIDGQVGWAEHAVSVENTYGLRLPARLPHWSDVHSLQPIFGGDGQRRFLDMLELEQLLSPALLAFEGRPGVIVPIRTRYLERLLGSRQQMTFGPKLRAELSRQRAYISDARSVRSYARNGILFFYESGSDGERAVVAAARISDAFLIARDEQDVESLSRSIFTPTTLDEIGSGNLKALCLFESALWLPQPVRLSSLRKMNIKDGQLITALKLSDSQAQEVLRLGGVR